MSTPEALPRLQILVCDGPSCGVTHESERLSALFEAGVRADPRLHGRVHVATYGCFGRCSEGPNVYVRRLGPGDDPREEPAPAVLERQRGFYPGVDEARCQAILTQHCGEGRPIDAWLDDY